MAVRAFRESDVVDEYGIMPWVPIDARVKVDGRLTVIITEAGKNCDCGKGLYCPENLQVVK
jgi:hypothetical protein